MQARQQRNPPSSQRVMPSCPPPEEEAPPSYDSLFEEPPMPSKIHNLPTKEQLYGDQINSGQVNKVTPTQPESNTEIPMLSAGVSLLHRSFMNFFFFFQNLDKVYSVEVIKNWCTGILCFC